MFQDVIQAILDALQPIALLRYIPTVTIGATGSPGTSNVWVSGAQAVISDNHQIVVPVHRPEPDQTAAKDYLPLNRIPLELTLNPRIVVVDPGDDSYDATMVALACMHALSYTDGVFADFIDQEHSLTPTGSGPPPNDTAFAWATYALKTVNITQFGPIDSPLGMELQLRLDGTVWLYPETAPDPTVIDDIRAPRQPPPPDPEVERGFDEIVRIATD